MPPFFLQRGISGTILFLVCRRCTLPSEDFREGKTLGNKKAPGAKNIFQFRAGVLTAVAGGIEREFR
jgi:hypothetical protein